MAIINRALIGLNIFLICSCSTLHKQEKIVIPRKPMQQVGKRILFNAYQIPEKGITYYFRPGESAESPLILTIQGSGCNSIYQKDNKGNIYGGLNVEAADSVKNKAAILTVEKPHIQTFFSSKDNNGVKTCSEEFKRDFVKSRWIEMLQTALIDVISTNQLNPSRIIVAGHSEGAEVAALLAAETPEISYVLMGGGGGAVQLYEFVVSRTVGTSGKRIERAKESQTVHEVLAQWKEMAKNPDAIEPLYMGHTPRYWTTFKASSSIEALKKSKAKIYIMQGTDDSSTPVTSTDLLAAELTIAQREFIYDRIANADHSFNSHGKDLFHGTWAKAFQWSIK